ncbi:MAG TPA: sulfocyanin-like copper-binding protein [Candidatus Limnocylindria bacterium]|nr:sulfocyanin-like copper-binding protein [Candidatus Limnocylindria bacterium]
MRLSLALLLGLALTIAACAPAAENIPADVDVAVHMQDYRVLLSVATMKAGQVRIGVKNEGGMEHSFELIKTDIAFDQLPTTADAKAKEDGLVKQVKSLAVGKVAVVTADLAAGKYVIICNIAGHYQLGMRAALTVN